MDSSQAWRDERGWRGQDRVEPGPIYNQPSSGKERKGASESSMEHRRHGKPRGDQRDDAYERMIGEIERRNATLMEFLGQRDASQAEQMEEFLERTANMITDVTERAMEHFVERQEVTMSQFMDAQVEALERQRHDNERAANQIEELCGLMKELVARETVIPSPSDMTAQGDRDNRYRAKVKIGKTSVSSGSEKETRNDSTERERGPRKIHTLNASRQSYLRLASAPPETQTEEWQRDRPPHVTRSPTQTPAPGKIPTPKRAPKVVSQLGMSGAMTHTGGTLLNRDEEFWARPGGMNAHQERLTNDYRQIIRDVLASTPDPTAGKGWKPPFATTLWDGDGDISTFEEWLRTYARTLEFSGKTLPGQKRQQLGIMAEMLSGEAKKWFNNHVDREKENWTVEEAIVALFMTFNRGTYASKATADFENVRYDQLKGVRGYLNELETTALRMVQVPDQLHIRRRFIEGLPKWMKQRITIVENMTPEHTRLETLINAVYQLEESKETWKMAQEWNKHDPAQTGKRTSQASRKVSTPPVPRRESKPAPKPTAPASKEKGKWGAGPPRKPEVKTKPRSDQVKCYGCGQMGHFAYDPICPSKKQLRAARETNSEELPNLEEVSDSEESAVDGDQYEPDTEDSDIPPHPQLEDIQESEHSGSEQIQRFQEYASDSDEEYLRAARISKRKETAHEPTPARGSMRKKDERPKGKQMCMVAWVEIGGTKALTLFDSGSTLDAVSPDFARTTNLRTFHLDKPINLQLGCVGSRGSINFGTRANTSIGELNLEVAGHYWDVINLDRYDAVVGVRFMRENGIVLDFAKGLIRRGMRTLEPMTTEAERLIVKGERGRASRD
jgi:hypothetical protein